MGVGVSRDLPRGYDRDESSQDASGGSRLIYEEPPIPWSVWSCVTDQASGTVIRVHCPPAAGSSLRMRLRTQRRETGWPVGGLRQQRDSMAAREYRQSPEWFRRQAESLHGLNFFFCRLTGPVAQVAGRGLSLIAVVPSGHRRRQSGLAGDITERKSDVCPVSQLSRFALGSRARSGRRAIFPRRLGDSGARVILVALDWPEICAGGLTKRRFLVGGISHQPGIVPPATTVAGDPLSSRGRMATEDNLPCLLERKSLGKGMRGDGLALGGRKGTGRAGPLPKQGEQTGRQADRYMM